MRNFFNLLYNENMKIFMRKSTWVMYIIIAAIIIGWGALAHTQADDHAKYQQDDWQQVLKQDTDKLIKEDKAHENDDDFYINHTAEIEKNNYFLEHDFQPVEYGAWQFVMESQVFLELITLFTVIIAAGVVANEFKWGTIKALLTRASSRTKVLLSKYAAVLTFALVTLVFLLVFAFLVGAVLFGVHGWNLHIIMDMSNGLEEISVMHNILTGFGYKLVTLVIMSAFAFMVSTIFRQSALAIGLAIFLMFAGNSIMLYFLDKSWAKYILFANTDLSQYASGGVPIMKGMTLGFSITVLIVYYVIFLAVTWLTFTKRDVAGH